MKVAKISGSLANFAGDVHREQVSVATQTDNPTPMDEGVSKLLSDYISIQTSVEEWVQTSKSLTESPSLSALRGYLTKASNLAVQLHQLLPSSDIDVSVIYEGICRTQFALSTECGALLFRHRSLRFSFPEPTWNLNELSRPFGLDEDTIYLFQQEVQPLRRRSARFNSHWGSLGMHFNVRSSELGSFQRACMEGNRLCSDWFGFFDMPKDYFSDVRDTCGFLQEASSTIFELGLSIARLRYAIKSIEAVNRI